MLTAAPLGKIAAPVPEMDNGIGARLEAPKMYLPLHLRAPETLAAVINKHRSVLQQTAHGNSDNRQAPAGLQEKGQLPSFNSTLVLTFMVCVQPIHLPDATAESQDVHLDLSGHHFWPIKRIPRYPQRRAYSKSFKAQVIQECSEPGAFIANIALGYRLNANLVHKWIRLYTQKAMALQTAFIPLHAQMLGAGSHAVPNSIYLEI